MIYVKDIMTRTVRTIGSNKSTMDAAKEMAKWKIGALIIIDDTAPIGIVTEGDISRSVAKGIRMTTTLAAFKKKHLVSVSSNERLEVAAKAMADAGVKKLPVMDGDKLVGIITQTDIVSSSFALVTSLKEMVQARYRPPDFQM